MSLLTLLMYRDSELGAEEETAACTYTYDVDAAYTFAPDEAYTYAPDEAYTYDPCADD